MRIDSGSFAAFEKQERNELCASDNSLRSSTVRWNATTGIGTRYQNDISAISGGEGKSVRAPSYRAYRAWKTASRAVINKLLRRLPSFHV